MRDGWKKSSGVPNPWTALRARPDLNLVRAGISEPGRYYDDERAIVLRRGLLLTEERRHLWHELVHADRRDTAGHCSAQVERDVERRAVRIAVPTVSLQWAAYQTETMHELAEMLKLPEDWVRFRWKVAPQWEKDLVRRQDPLYGEI